VSPYGARRFSASKSLERRSIYAAMFRAVWRAIIGELWTWQMFENKDGDNPMFFDPLDQAMFHISVQMRSNYAEWETKHCSN
jgi:hypothetical protein